MFKLIIYLAFISFLESSTIHIEGENIKKSNQYNENGRLIIPEDKVINSLKTLTPRIELDEEISIRALTPIKKMLELSN